MRQLEFIFSRRDKLRRTEGSGNQVEGELPMDVQLTEQCRQALQDLPELAGHSGRKSGLVIRLAALAGEVRVQWNTRMRSTAGRAFWPCAKIELNPQLQQLAPSEVERTLLHELAHLLAYARAGRRRISAHGVEWQKACADLGIAGERATHSLPLPGRTMQRKWHYHCPTCGEGFDRVRKMKRRAACYSCCKTHNGGYYHDDYRLRESPLDPE